MFVSLLLLLSAVQARAAGDCDTPSRATDVLGATQQVSIAWATKDGQALRDQHSAAISALECVQVQLDATVISQVHLAEGLAAFYGKDYTASEQAFAGVLAIDQGYQLPDVLHAPPPLVQRLDMARKLSSLHVPIEAPGYTVLVDGAASSQRPANRASVVQVVLPDQQVLWTRYVHAGEALPEIPAIVAPKTSSKKPPKTSSNKPPKTSSNKPPKTSSNKPPKTDRPSSKARVRSGLGVGLDVGAPTSLRVETRPSEGVVRALGGRLMAGVATDFLSPFPMFGLQLYVDLGVARHTSIEVGPIVSTTIEDFPIGLGMAVRQELSAVVHVQVGAMAGIFWEPRMMPDVHVGFVW